MSLQFRSNGKLLLTGEYVVLDGAKALAVPTIKGQSLLIEPIDQRVIEWESFDHESKPWFDASIKMTDAIDPMLVLSETNSPEVASRLLRILRRIQKLNPSIFNNNYGYRMKNVLDFPRDWGLGSSSTLINNLSEWASIDPYDLLGQTFGGSGYDIACARSNGSITYEITEHKLKPEIQNVDFNPAFKDHLYFVHLNKKQNSREGISRYKSIGKIDNTILDEISEITEAFIISNTIQEFNLLMQRHERLISNLIELDTVQDHLFPDFPGQLKSLGAWGGDFIMASSTDDIPSYFTSKGYTTIVPYREMVLNKKAPQ